MLNIAYLGCGTGGATLVLAENLNTNITAIDIFDEFLVCLNNKTRDKFQNSKIISKNISMSELPFENETLDVIWSEGAIYNMGFKKGISYLKKFLKPGGILAGSVITWLTEQRPVEISEYWEENYPEIALASQKIDQI